MIGILELDQIIDDADDIDKIRNALRMAINVIWSYETTVAENNLMGVFNDYLYEQKYEAIAQDMLPISKRNQKMIDIIDKNI